MVRCVGISAFEGVVSVIWLCIVTCLTESCAQFAVVYDVLADYILESLCKYPAGCDARVEEAVVAIWKGGRPVVTTCDVEEQLLLVSELQVTEQDHTLPSGAMMRCFCCVSEGMLEAALARSHQPEWMVRLVPSALMYV